MRGGEQRAGAVAVLWRSSRTAGSSPRALRRGCNGQPYSGPLPSTAFGSAQAQALLLRRLRAGGGDKSALLRRLKAAGVRPSA